MMKDWFLVAINPWHKWYYNPKTGQHKHIKRENNND